MMDLKTWKKILFALAVTLLFAGFTALIGCGGSETVYKNGTVTEVVGDARVYRDGGSLPAYDGLLLRHGDVIKTDKDSTVAFTLNGEMHVLLEPVSAVTLCMYENEDEKVVRPELTGGAVYTEVDAVAAEGTDYGVSTPDCRIFGDENAYRVVLVSGETRSTFVYALSGNVSITASNGADETRTIEKGQECRVDGMGKGGNATFVSCGDVTDPYTLPDRYIELGEEGVFDASGKLIPKLPSADLSVRSMILTDVNGNTVELIPEFDDSIPGYIAETDSPYTLTVTANHKKASVKLLCHTADSVEENGNTATVTFSADGKYHSVYILVIAENGEEAEFSVNIVPFE